MYQINPESARKLLEDVVRSVLIAGDVLAKSGEVGINFHFFPPNMWFTRTGFQDGRDSETVYIEEYDLKNILSVIVYFVGCPDNVWNFIISKKKEPR